MEDSMEEVDWLKIFVILVFAGLIIYLGNRFYPDMKWYFSPSLVIIVGTFFFWNFGRAILWKSRYNSYQVNVNGCHGSIYGNPEYIRDDSVRKGFVWAVFNLGHSTFPVSLRGKLKTLVVPADQLFPAGKGFNGQTLVQKYPLGSLPYPVHSYLRHNKNDFNLDNIFFGKYSQEYKDNSGNELDLHTQIMAKDTLIGVLQKTVEHDFGNFEEIKEFADRLSTNKTFVKKMVERVKGVNEEE